MMDETTSTGDVQGPDGDRDMETVLALLEREIADDVASNIRHARANVRCLDCGIRYEEREDYPCGEPGFGHDGFTDEMLADAEAEGRAEPIEYVTLAVADLRAALAPQPAQSGDGVAEAVTVLIAHAEGRAWHTYQGACPDEMDRDARDPACPVCAALIARTTTEEADHG